MSVFAFGSINVFEKRGSYQFIVSQVKLEGIGELQKRIEQLKKKLLVETRATLTSFISLYPESVFTEQVKKILNDLPEVE